MPPARLRSLLTIPPVLTLAGLLVFAVTRLPQEPSGLAQHFDQRMHESGVSHPVTAVLLNFRAYDTWFETVVLLLSALGLLVLRGRHDLADLRQPGSGDQVLAWLSRLLIPLMVLAGGYLLWLGSHSPGGAFQAGAVLAAALILHLAAGGGSVTKLRGVAFHIGLSAGVVSFLLIAFGTVAAGRRLLELPLDAAGTIIVVVEAAVAIAVAVTLAALFVGAVPAPDDGAGN